MKPWLPRTGVVISAACRTPFQKAGTGYFGVPMTELAAAVMREALLRGRQAADGVDEVILGCVGMPLDAANPARVAAGLADIPAHVPAMTVQRNCASGLEALAAGAMKVDAGLAARVLCCGAENMSRYPMVLPDSILPKMGAWLKAKSFGQKVGALSKMRPADLKPDSALRLGLSDPLCNLNMGQTAEKLAGEFGVSRAEQDAFALRSHQLAAARKDGPIWVQMPTAPNLADNGVRANQTLEALAALPPFFDRRFGSVTVGNACQVTDGAAALLVESDGSAAARGAPVLARVLGYAVAALDPSRMGLGPAHVLPALLQATGRRWEDLAQVEINEAFAAQVLACQRALGQPEWCRKHLGWDGPGPIPERLLNPRGGAIALGHPVGASGARLALEPILHLGETGGLAAVSLCVGGGQGAAMLLEIQKGARP